MLYPLDNLMLNDYLTFDLDILIDYARNLEFFDHFVLYVVLHDVLHVFVNYVVDVDRPVDYVVHVNWLLDYVLDLADHVAPVFLLGAKFGKSLRENLLGKIS